MPVLAVQEVLPREEFYGKIVAVLEARDKGIKTSSLSPGLMLPPHWVTKNYWSGLKAASNWCGCYSAPRHSSYFEI